MSRDPGAGAVATRAAAPHADAPVRARPAGSARPVIGIVAPALETSGGVQALAARLVDHIEAEPVWDYVLVSLATSATDDCSTRLARPSTWFAEPGTRALAWQGRQVTHVGSAFAEIELDRKSVV